MRKMSNPSRVKIVLIGKKGSTDYGRGSAGNRGYAKVDLSRSCIRDIMNFVSFSKKIRAVLSKTNVGINQMTGNTIQVDMR